MWAYPREFNSIKNAGQVRGSQHRYTRMSGTSALLLTLHGYAVMHNAAMPIVGPVETANDTFVAQLVSGAKAAIDGFINGLEDAKDSKMSGLTEKEGDAMEDTLENAVDLLEDARAAM